MDHFSGDTPRAVELSFSQYVEFLKKIFMCQAILIVVEIIPTGLFLLLTEEKAVIPKGATSSSRSRKMTSSTSRQSTSKSKHSSTN